MVLVTPFAITSDFGWKKLKWSPQTAAMPTTEPHANAPTSGRKPTAAATTTTTTTTTTASNHYEAAVSSKKDYELLMASFRIYTPRVWNVGPMMLKRTSSSISSSSTTAAPGETTTTTAAAAASRVLSSPSSTSSALMSSGGQSGSDDDGRRRAVHKGKFRLICEKLTTRKIVIAVAASLQEIESDFAFIKQSLERLGDSIRLSRELFGPSSSPSSPSSSSRPSSRPSSPTVFSPDVVGKQRSGSSASNSSAASKSTRLSTYSSSSMYFDDFDAVVMMDQDPRMARVAIPDPDGEDTVAKQRRRLSSLSRPLSRSEDALPVHTVAPASPDDSDDGDIVIDAALERKIQKMRARSQTNVINAARARPNSSIYTSDASPASPGTPAGVSSSSAQHSAYLASLSLNNLDGLDQLDADGSPAPRALGGKARKARNSASTSSSDSIGGHETESNVVASAQMLRVTEKSIHDFFETLRHAQTPNMLVMLKQLSKYKFLGTFEVTDTVLGSGTFSIVKLGINIETGKKYALKFFSKDHSDGLGMMRQELAILQGLHHPSIVSVESILETDRNFCMALQYVPNGSLLNFLNRNWNVEFAMTTARVIFKQIVVGVGYLHEHGIAHRDLKPDNILLDQNLRPVIIDFGLSKWLSNEAKDNCGSPIYAAPELMMGQTQDLPAVDVWALGVILFNMLTKEMPFEFPQDTPIPEMYRHIERTPFHVPLHVSRDAEALVRSAMALDPTKRLKIPEILGHSWLSAVSIPEAVEAPVSTTFEQIGNRAVKELLNEHEGKMFSSKWKHVSSEEDLTCFVDRKEASALCRVKCKGMIEASSAELVDLLTNMERRKEFDSMLTYGRSVERVSDTCSVLYTVHESQLYFSKAARDFCFVLQRVEDPDSGRVVLASKSVTHRLCPPANGLVRAEVLPSGWIIEPITPRKVWATYILQLDLKGNVSSSLMKRIQGEVPKFIPAIRAILATQRA